jgi:hypothetical protein
MDVFFSHRPNAGVLQKQVIAIDIHTYKYIVRIRENGILVLDSETKEIVLDNNLDLGEIIKKK